MLQAQSLWQANAAGAPGLELQMSGGGASGSELLTSSGKTLASKEALVSEELVDGAEVSVLGSGLVSGLTKQQGGKKAIGDMEVDQKFTGNVRGS